MRAIDFGIVGAVGATVPVAIRGAAALAVEPAQPAPDAGFYLALLLLAGLGFVIGMRSADFSRAFAFGFMATAVIVGLVGGALNAAPIVTHAAEKVGDAPRAPRPTDVGDLIDELSVRFPGRPTALGDFRWALGAPRYLQPLDR